MNGYIEDSGPVFSSYEGARISQSMAGEMSTEQAVAHALEVKALLQKASSVPISSTTVRIMPDGRLEITYGATLLYIEAQDLELLQEQCTLAIRVRENYDPNRVTDGIPTPAPTDASAAMAPRLTDYVPGVGSTTQVGKYSNQAHPFKVIEEQYNARVKAAQAPVSGRFNW